MSVRVKAARYDRAVDDYSTAEDGEDYQVFFDALVEAKSVPLKN